MKGFAACEFNLLGEADLILSSLMLYMKAEVGRVEAGRHC